MTTTPQQAQQSNPECSLTEQAAAWFLRIQRSNCSETDKKKFEAWLAEKETNRTEYQKYVQLWKNLDQLDREPEQIAYKKKHAMVTWGIFFVVMLGALHWLYGYEEIIMTAKGERRQINLMDGTTIDINTDSDIRLALFRFARKVTIDRGEISIKTPPRNILSFEVHAGNGILRHIDTKFNVAKEADKTTVAVLEGTVEINFDNRTKTTKRLSGGEQLSYSANGSTEITRINAEVITAWQYDRIIFRETPLDEVIRQINRYHARPLILRNTLLSQLKISEEFHASDRSGLIKTLKTLFSLRSREHNDTTVLETQ